MLKAEQIPDEVVGKVKALVDEMGGLAPPIRDFEAREIAVAVLAAWPGARDWNHCARCNEGPHLLLPLPKEASDEPRS